MFYGTLIIISISIPMFIIASIKDKHAHKKNLEEIKTTIEKLPDFTLSFQYVGDDGASAIVFDEPNAKVCLLHRDAGGLKHRFVTYKDIISSELCEDGTITTKIARSSQIGGAVVGGMLLGEAGAVIGALSGKKVEENKINRIELRLIVNDTSEPTYSLCFLNAECLKGDAYYNYKAKEARQWQARMEVLINRAERESSGEQRSNNNATRP